MPARKSYQIGLLFTHENGDFGAISVTERYVTLWRSTFEIGAAQLRSVTDFPPQQPLLCVKRSRILYDSRGGAKAIRYHVNIAEVSKTTTLHVHHYLMYISLSLSLRHSFPTLT